MAIDFPASPTVGQTFTSGGRTWVYSSGGTWDVPSSSSLPFDLTIGGSFTANNYDVAGKNKIINGAFEINQRNLGTITNPAGVHGLDRWFCVGYQSGTSTYTPTLFSVGETPEGFPSNTFMRIVTSGQTATSTRTEIRQHIEDVSTLAGQTVTISFWARAATGTPKVAIGYFQEFGAGGTSPSARNVKPIGSVTISTLWAKYSVTTTLDSIAGKTLGTDGKNYLCIRLFTSAGADFSAEASSIGIQNTTIDIWGVQLERGSVATPFSRAGGTYQGELAACQRYYYRVAGPSNGSPLALPGPAFSSTQCMFSVPFPVVMRTTPSSTFDWTGTIANYKADNFGAGAPSTPTISSFTLSNFSTHIVYGYMSGTGFSQNYHYMLEAASSGAYIGFSAEL